MTLRLIACGALVAEDKVSALHFVRLRALMNPTADSSTYSQGSLEECVQQAEYEYAARYGQPARWVVAAPGRVNLIGEHTDYNDGFVLPMAIERYTVIAAGPSGPAAGATGSPAAHFYSVNLDDGFEMSLDVPPEPRLKHWSGYVAGVIAGWLQRGCQLPAFNAVIRSTVPTGSGLSSSAALEVATATLVESITGTRLEKAEKALLCQEAEHRFAGVPCGIMDQFSSVFGEQDMLMLLDCRSQQIEPVPFADGGVSMLIINSNVKHELAGGEYAQRRQQCETAAVILGVDSLRDATFAGLEAAREKMGLVEYRRARHVIGEIDRTRRAAEAFRAGQWQTLGDLMYASHQSLRDDYEVSCSELDTLVETAQEIGSQGGVIGSRMTGGGFGGCTVSLVIANRANEVAEQISTRYQKATGIQPQIFASRPARGAHVVRP